MLNSFRMLASNFTDNTPVSATTSTGEPSEDPEADINDLLLDRRVSGSTVSTTGMKNPQDDLEQSHPTITTTTTTTQHHGPPKGENCNSISPSNSMGLLDGNSSPIRDRKQPQSLHLSQNNNSQINPQPPVASAPPLAVPGGSTTEGKATVVSRRRVGSQKRRRRRRHRSTSSHKQHPDNNEKENNNSGPSGPLDAMCSVCLGALCLDKSMVKNTLSCMNILARIVVWTSVIALAAGVVWYSYELTNNGTDPHLIAWFSAGAFVLLGFPLSMGSIVAHLANYNQPHVQCYIVRILWMVPIYSMESWLCLRFHEYAIYIETLRDCYESFVLYSFLQFLIQVLGGEEALILMLKDKSPTRGSHMWGLQWCIKPWLMGQPVRRSVIGDNCDENDKKSASSPSGSRNSLKRVHWKSPFFVKCKFGVLQYVLLKLVCSIVAVILELHGLYKEGNFTPKGGYLYVCIITNISQCWALYCMILFYYATHNELSPINPVGKFLSVKALVFFTWWQSVGISILYQMDMIPHYNDSKATKTWSSEDVAKGLQDYLICVEMFFAAIVHTLVFPHSEYSPQAVQARGRALNQSVTNPGVWQQRKRLGRHHQFHTNQLLSNYRNQKDERSIHSGSKSSYGGGDRSFFDLEMTTLSSGGGGHAGTLSWDEPATVDKDGNIIILPVSANRIRSMSNESHGSDLSPLGSPGHPSNYDWSTSPNLRQVVDDWSDDVESDGTPDTRSLLLADTLAQERQKYSAPPSLVQPSLQDRHDTIDEGEDEDAYVDSPYDDEDDERDELGGSGSTYSATGGSEDDKEESGNQSSAQPYKKHNFVRAFLDSAIPRDLRENTVGIVRGDYVVEKKTLLHHATTSDHYDLFSDTRRSNFRKAPGNDNSDLASKKS